MMDTKRTLLALAFFFPLVLNAQSALRLWYEQPASASVPDSPNGWKDDSEWLKALPLGNGALGAMVFGDVNKERIQLNEESMWSGSPDDNDNPSAFQYLDSIRVLLFNGKYKEATEMTNRTQVCKGKGSGYGNGATVPFGCFQTLGDLWIDNGRTSAWKNYHRELDLKDAVVRISYDQDGVHFVREVFVSQPDQVLVARFTASKAGQISLCCRMNRPERFHTYAEGNQLLMAGALSDGKGGDGLNYEARLQAVAKKGIVSCTDSSLCVKAADEVVLLLSASTDYKLSYPSYKGRNFDSITTVNVSKASAKPFSELLKAHVKEYQRYFDRVEFSLNKNLKDTVATDRRLAAFKQGRLDSHLYELMFQYGRYLLISSSRPGCLPANLQGIWANKIQTPWNGDYHTDVNIEMNYWPAEITNLPEMHLPMFDLISSLVEPGTRTAQVQYHAKGWVVHPITNVWGYTSPGEGASWGMHTGATAWICQHIAEHYRFTGDTAFLRRMYPVLEGAVKFYLSWLVKDPRTGKLVSGPAVSPENTFVAPDGSQSQISMGPAHDQEVIAQLFEDFNMVTGELGIQNELVNKVSLAYKRLAGPRIGSDGRLMEWAQEFPEVEPGHRHISHLFAVHPGSQINLIQTPALAAAAEKSLDYRIANGGGHTGWSAAWLVNQYARLHRAEKALGDLNVVISKSTSPNLFGMHPPFQMDANFGTTAGIAEMLLQSQVPDGEGSYILDLLPALPKSWAEGSIRGLKARGNVIVDLTWKAGRLTEARLYPATEATLTLRYGDRQIRVQPHGKKCVVVAVTEF
jgi:alpha-L-fucosidase 2